MTALLPALGGERDSLLMALPGGESLSFFRGFLTYGFPCSFLWCRVRFVWKVKEASQIPQT